MEQLKSELIELGNNAVSVFGGNIEKATVTIRELNNLLKDKKVRAKLPEMIELVEKHKEDPQMLMGLVLAEIMV